MDDLTLTNRRGEQIQDWRRWTRPKRDYQWECGRSAMELARSWFTSPTPVCPPEVRELLDSHKATAGIALSHGKPEHVTSLPMSGEGRNHDLLLFGKREGAPVIVSVEAKVDETFGERVGKYWSKKSTDGRSGAPRRIEALLSCVFGAAAKPDKQPWQGLRYQLLTALVGTAIEASEAGARTAVFIVHELHTAKASRNKLAKNATAVAELLRVCGFQVKDDDPGGRLHGPIPVNSPRQSASPVDIFVGRAVYTWEPPSPGAA